MKKKYKVILVSGGFDPVHKGHLEMIDEASKLANEVWVILNNDRRLFQKKVQAFMSEEERSYIMSRIKNVSNVIICNPKGGDDKTVCDGIYEAVIQYRRKFKYKGKNISMAFGNRGDRVEKLSNVPEVDYCESMNVDVVWGLGKKIQSSSWLLEKFQNQELQPENRQYRSNQGRSPLKVDRNMKVMYFTFISFIVVAAIALIWEYFKSQFK